MVSAVNAVRSPPTRKATASGRRASSENVAKTTAKTRRTETVMLMTTLCNVLLCAPFYGNTSVESPTSPPGAITPHHNQQRRPSDGTTESIRKSTTAVSTHRSPLNTTVCWVPSNVISDAPI